MITKEILENAPEVPEEVKVFTDTYCRNHATMLRAWKDRPEMGDDYTALLGQLCRVWRTHRNKTIIQRLLGRISVVRRALELEEFGESKKDMGVLG